MLVTFRGYKVNTISRDGNKRNNKERRLFDQHQIFRSEILRNG